MNAFLGNRNSVKLFVALIFFAFAKANSQQNAIISTDSTIIIGTLTTKVELLKALKSLREDHQLDVKLTAYKSNVDEINRLGLELRDRNNKKFVFETENDLGIEDVCLKIKKEGIISYLGLCKSLNPDGLESDLFVQSAVKSTDDQSKITIIEKKVSQGTETDKAKGLTTFVVNNTDQESRKQQLVQMRENSVLRDTKRLGNLSAQKLDYESGKIQALEQQKEIMIDDTQSLKEQQIAIRAELKDLENQTKRIKRERKTLDYNNLRALAIRDSLQQQQLRLIEVNEQENNRLAATMAAQKEGQNVIDRQNQVIKEQGLRAETAEGIKAYRTAIMGGSKDEVLKKQGYLFFAADQCSYKVYEGYTIVYSLLGKMLFTINKELLAPTVNGTLNISGKPYDYLFASNYLIIKDEKGQMVNEYGDLLDRSLETNTVMPFVKSHDFTIRNKTSPRELLAMKTDMKILGIEMEVFEQYRDDKNILIDLSFTLQGKQYVFQDIKGISDIILEIDQPNDQLRVLSKR